MELLCFDLSALRCAECRYREILAVEPADMGVRVELAWCLFIQSLHMTGRESALAQPEIARQSRLSPAERETDTSSLLRECGRQMVAVMQLSTNRSDRLSMEQLQASIKMAYGAGANTQTQDTGARILTDLTRAMFNITAAVAESKSATTVTGAPS